MQSGKKISRADLEVTINSDASATVVQRKTDPNETHPYSATELIDRVNRSRKIGRKLTMYDLTCMAWKHNMRNNPQFAWQSRHNLSCVWSGDALSFLKNRTDAECDLVRAEYRQYLKDKKRSKK